MLTRKFAPTVRLVMIQGLAMEVYISRWSVLWASVMIGSSFHDFETAVRAVLAFLHHRLGFGLWMVTRTEGEDWIVLQTEGHAYDVNPGQVFCWTDSFCSRMVKGMGHVSLPTRMPFLPMRQHPLASRFPSRPTSVCP